MPTVDPVLLSEARVLAAWIIFFAGYLVFALGSFPWMKIDRTGAAIIGAVLMVAFGFVGAREALASIDFATVVLLFSMMLIVANIRLAGFFEWITAAVIERLHPTHLLPIVFVASGVLSAFLWALASSLFSPKPKSQSPNAQSLRSERPRAQSPGWYNYGLPHGQTPAIAL